ncbi:MAG TPA: Asp-tRNA(Asn)/Glu-tRNA(Gln) amidotransferase subunit GatA [Actinomycetales bacterium]|nr:Asp-tRNA(Asn)/Glu-tRNA(Gln) amidotransferase subunit GatA [Actinomycetales bacterium]
MSKSAQLIGLSAAQLSEKLQAGEISAVEATQAHIDRIADVDEAVHAFLTRTSDQALQTASEVDSQRAAGADLHALAGVPIALKDNIVTEGVTTTCASRMLAQWNPVYSATVAQRIADAGLPLLGKTNMDEFAMGSTTETSAFGPTHNPWDLNCHPGGSGGGSAAALAAYSTPLALGSDTGGSIRQPGAVTGTVGVKPTYGSVSRYGVIALASSLDQVGPAARTVLDAALLHELIAGYDPRDNTSLNEPVPPVVAAAREGATGDLRGVRIGVITELAGEGYQEDVRLRFAENLDALRQAGAEVVEVSCPNIEHALAAYDVLNAAEASSNLARFDGMRFGERVEPTDGRPVTVDTVMSASRGAGFGLEVKRRILLGIYALSGENYETVFANAQRVRSVVTEELLAAFKAVDVLVSPTSPAPAGPLGDGKENPEALLHSDVGTIAANLAGTPAMSIPAGLSENNLPVGLQIIAPQRADDRMYRVGAALETALQERWGAPLLAQAPALGQMKVEVSK